MFQRFVSFFNRSKGIRPLGVDPSIAPKFVLQAMLKRDGIDAQVAMHWLADGGVILYVESNTQVSARKMLSLEWSIKNSDQCGHVLHVFWTFTPMAIRDDSRDFSISQPVAVGSSWVEERIAEV